MRHLLKGDNFQVCSSNWLYLRDDAGEIGHLQHQVDEKSKEQDRPHGIVELGLDLGPVTAPQLGGDFGCVEGTYSINKRSLG